METPDPKGLQDVCPHDHRPGHGRDLASFSKWDNTALGRTKALHRSEALQRRSDSKVCRTHSHHPHTAPVARGRRRIPRQRTRRKLGTKQLHAFGKPSARPLERTEGEGLGNTPPRVQREFTSVSACSAHRFRPCRTKHTNVNSGSGDRGTHEQLGMKTHPRKIGSHLPVCHIRDFAASVSALLFFAISTTVRCYGQQNGRSHCCQTSVCRFSRIDTGNFGSRL